MSAPYVFTYRGEFTFPLGPGRIWSILQRPERYETWWSWMRELEVEGNPLEPGSVISFAVVAPIPFKMHIRLEVVEADPPNRLVVAVRGDLAGTGSLLLDEAEGSTAAVEWDVEINPPAMRRTSYVARPVLKWAHDRAVASGVAGFRRQIERGDI